MAYSLGLSLLEQLLRHNKSLCHDAHDIVYALLHISLDGSAFVPDYTKSVESLFYGVAEYYASNGQLLPLIVYATIRPLTINLKPSTVPHEHRSLQRTFSWVPDWRLTLPTSASGESFIYSTCEALLSEGFPKHTAIEILDHKVAGGISHTLVFDAWMFSDCEHSTGPTQRKERIVHQLQLIEDDHDRLWRKIQSFNNLHTVSDPEWMAWKWCHDRRRLLATETLRKHEVSFEERLQNRYKRMKELKAKRSPRLWDIHKYIALLGFRTARSTTDRVNYGLKLLRQSSHTAKVTNRLKRLFKKECRLLKMYSEFRGREHQSGMISGGPCMPCLLRVGWEIKKAVKLNPRLALCSSFRMLCLPKTDLTFLAVRIKRQRGRPRPPDQPYRLVFCFQRAAYKWEGSLNQFMEQSNQTRKDFRGKDRVIAEDPVEERMPRLQRIHIM